MTTASTGLRARRRQELLAAIRTAALGELRRSGAAGLSLRAVARDVGIAVSALYRYFPSRDELLTDLIVAAFDEHADAVEAGGAHDDVGEALRGVWHAYRAWAVAHPAEFGLAYGTPVPGYVAPPEDTVRAGSRIGRFALGLLARAYAEGRLDPDTLHRRAARLSPGTAEQLETWSNRHGQQVPTEVLAVWLDLFVRLHGLVSMEVFGLLRPITPDTAPYTAEVVDTELAALLGPRP
ncbi:TetR/AcrR family transcriptional regulator [Phytohabitans rumicis]|uniref:TetR/AcrR family transcriptional regulator n=1 Tax=Phytohabitans rumicis TaxID=1076125 RepID=UPI0031EEFCA2